VTLRRKSGVHPGYSVTDRVDSHPLPSEGTLAARFSVLSKGKPVRLRDQQPGWDGHFLLLIMEGNEGGGRIS